MSSPDDSTPRALVSAQLLRLCRWGQAVALFALALILSWLAYLAFHPDEIMAQAMVGIPAPELPASPAADIAGKLVLAAPALLFAYALWRLWQLFGEIRQGLYFTAGAQSLLAQLGWIALLGSVFAILCNTIGILLLTSGNPPGKKMLSIAFSSGEMSGLIMGLLLFIFARLLREMAAVAEENRSII